MDWLSEYIKAWSGHNIHFGTIKHLNIIDPPRSVEAVIVDDECLTYRFPYSYRVRNKRGQLNERFLDPASLLRALDGLPEGMTIVLSIPEIWRTEELSFIEFLCRLEMFLSALPSSYRYAIQLHNGNYLLPDYFECLRQNGIAYVMSGPCMDRSIFTTDLGLIDNAKQSEIVHTVRCAIEEKKKLYVYVENSTELSHAMEQLNNDLKRLSPIKRSVAA